MIRVPTTLFFRILLDWGKKCFPLINKKSVAVKRVWSKRSKEERARITEKARAGITPEHYTNRRYSEEGLESLQNHMRTKVNTAEHYKKRDMSNCKTDVFRKMMSCIACESHFLRGSIIHEKEETERINNYSGVLTASQLAQL